MERPVQLCPWKLLDILSFQDRLDGGVVVFPVKVDHQVSRQFVITFAFPRVAEDSAWQLHFP